MAYKIQFKRGLKSLLPALSQGEPGITTDTNEVYIGKGDGTNILLMTEAKFATGNAENPNKVDNSKHSDSATEANHAASADEADHAATADSATSAETANTADEANHAATADSATSAETANTATSAGHASTADSAGAASSAVTAQKDIDGNDIKTVYAKKTDLELFIDTVYPVSSIYFSVSSVNPATIFGRGTWVQWGNGKIPVGVDTGDSAFNTVEKTGGSKTHTITKTELPTDRIKLSASGGTNPTASMHRGHEGGISDVSKWGVVGIGSDDFEGDLTTFPLGDGTPMNIQNPYITCYMWKRTA